MIIDQVDVDDVVLFETENDAPVARHRNTLEAAQVPGQRMQPQPVEIHVARQARHVQITEKTSDPGAMRRMSARSIAAFVQQSQSPVSETADHPAR
jgi:hypothetical protein